MRNEEPGRTSLEVPAGADEPLLLAVLRRHWVAVVVAAAICAVLGALVGATLTKKYQSTATVLIAPLEGDPYSPESVGRQSQANTDALTDARLAATPAVARRAENSLGLPRGSLSWRSKLSVEVVPNSQVVKITYQSASGAKARDAAQAFAAGYLAYRASRSQASVAGQLNELQARARRIQRRVTAASSAAAVEQNPTHRAVLKQQVAIYHDQLAALAVQTAQLAGESRGPGQVLTPASAAVAKGLRTSELAVIGAIAGLLVGLALAVVREASDDRLRNGLDIESAGLPLLAVLKAPRREAPDDDETERYRMLRNVVLTNAPGPRVIALSALSSASASGEVTAGLGTALARAGHEVTVVLPSPEAKAATRDRPGLAEVLLDGHDAGAVRELVAPRLYLLGPGSQIEAATEMFAGESLQTVLHELAGPGGYTLVATPLAGTAHAAALAAVCDQVILLCPLGATTSEELTTTAREIGRLRGEVLGAIAIEQPTRGGTTGGPSRSIFDPGVRALERGGPALRRAASSLPRASRALGARSRAVVSRREARSERRRRPVDPAVEGRLNALSSVAATLDELLGQTEAASGYSESERPARDDNVPSTGDAAAAPAGDRGDPGAAADKAPRSASTGAAGTAKRKPTQRRRQS